MNGTSGRASLLLSTMVLLLGCEGTSPPRAAASPPDEPSPRYRNVATATAYVGDEACASCHREATSAYRDHAMARSFHRWTPDVRIEAPLAQPLHHGPTGFSYAVVEVGDALYQEEYLIGPDGRHLHELRRRIDYVMGSGSVARTYFTEENGRLFQLPLTWYRERGWDFSPGYEVNNARFGRLMPDRCIACHGSYPQPIPFLEGKYAALPPGIGCERCHGPGALHVTERSSGSPPDSTDDNTIVNPSDLPFERRLDVCEQCHVHTPVTVFREGQTAFGYLPSQPLRDHVAFFKAAGSIDIVSHADRLRQSGCFIATRPSERPLECATCHNPHRPSLDQGTRNEPCRTCHPPAALTASRATATDHGATSDCVSCHMPRVKERAVPHGSFTDHWIRIITTSPTPGRARRTGDSRIEPYFERDRSGPDGEVYRGMGAVVYATLADDARLLGAAAAALDRALGGDTTRADAHFLLGLAYRQLGRPGDAVRALERSLRLDPDRPDRLHALARAYETMGRDPAAVARLYEQALALQPALAWIRADYARFLQTQWRREEAEQGYRAALAEHPSLDVAAFNFGTLLTGVGRLTEATELFRHAVSLNPALAEGLAPLLQVRTTGNLITGVRILGSPLEAMPVRYRGPDAVRLTVATRVEPGVLFVNVPPRSSVRILEPDGTVVRALQAGDSPTLVWNLMTEAGDPIGGGFYHVQVRGQGRSGRPAAPQRFSFGVVRLRGS
jgi:Flp pilus assembly protein TadD